MSTRAGKFFDLDRTMEAAHRYRDVLTNRGEQVDAAKRGRIAKADRPDRIRKNAEYLIQKADASGIGLPSNLREELSRIASPEVPKVGAVDSEFLERTIGKTRDYLSFAFLEDGLIAGKSVGRVVVPMDRGTAYGSGFLVSPHLFLTNNHVLPNAETAARSTVEFDYETGRDGRPKRSQSFKILPDLFFLTDEEHDFALVALKDTADSTSISIFGFCPLVEQEGKILVGSPVNIIQHPNGDFKQVVLRENRLVNLENEQGPNLFAHYSTDTEPGSSGSPVFNDQWDVIALHHSGVPAMNKKGQLLNLDGKPWTKAEGPDRLQWVANEGIRVSRLVKFIESADLTGQQATLRDELLARKDVGGTPEERIKNDGSATGNGAKTQPVRDDDEQAPYALISIGDQARRAGTRVTTVTIPVRITVEIGDAGETVNEEGTDNEFQEKSKRVPKPDTDYATRKGFDPNFLGFRLPLPTLANILRSDLLKPSGTSKGELKYHHYSVLMSASRRLAFVSAVNINGDAPFKEPRGSDRWYYDQRLEQYEQIGPDVYEANDLDRGHLTRRDDAAWGKTAAEARLGNDDTFHWTNCSPQHLVFNQSEQAEKRGLELWGNLENHVTKQLARGFKRLCVFNGPVFRKDDPSYRSVQLPREYWKLVAYKGDDGKARAAAFKLSQAELLDDMPKELTFDPGSFRVFQIKVRDLEALTRLDFGDLYKGDALEEDGKETFFAEGTEMVPLRKLDDIVL